MLTQSVPNDRVDLATETQTTYYTHWVDEMNFWMPGTSQIPAEWIPRELYNSDEQYTVEPSMVIATINQLSSSTASSTPQLPSSTGSSPGLTVQSSPSSCDPLQSPSWSSQGPSPAPSITTTSSTFANWDPTATVFRHTDHYASDPRQEQGSTYLNHGSELLDGCTSTNKFGANGDAFGSPIRNGGAISAQVPSYDGPSLISTGTVTEHLPLKGRRRNSSAIAMKDDGYPQVRCPECTNVHLGRWAKSNLERHRKQKHKGPVKRFPCPYCPLGYSRSDGLVKHKARKHASTRAQDKGVDHAWEVAVDVSSIVNTVQDSYKNQTHSQSSVPH